MERKIGEIFEHNGEMYQCVESPYCLGCAFEGAECYKTLCIRGICVESERVDSCPVIFKKLEKAGEPYEYFIQGLGITMLQEYILANPSYTCDDNKHVFVLDCQNGKVAIELKQTKEDMEEKKLNLKTFDIQKAREGKPVCTRDGRKARILCYDLKGAEYPIVAAVETRDRFAESIFGYDKNGRFDHDTENNNDLMMLPEKKEGWINVYDDAPIYDTKEEALNRRSEFRGYIDTIKVSCEE